MSKGIVYVFGKRIYMVKGGPHICDRYAENICGIVSGSESG